MVLGQQKTMLSAAGVSNFQPAFQLAAFAAHLAPRSQSWAPFLQFANGMPMFAPFLTQSHFRGQMQHNLLNTSHINRNSQPSNLQNNFDEDSDDEVGKKTIMQFC